MEGFVSKILRKFRHMKFLSKCKFLLKKINNFEHIMEKLTDKQIKNKTQEFKNRYSNGESLNDLLPEVFAVVREASKRVFNMRQFDVQIIGGIVLHYGNIAEMRTGEGKTLSAVAPAYLNTLSGNQVHIVTVNDYLAKVGAESMSKLYDFLGVTVGYINQYTFNKREMYRKDILYTTNSEIVFDYLKDNMKESDDFFVRDFYFVIIDEVDSILIDEARTPLIISGESSKASDLCIEADKIIKQLNKDDYEIDEKYKQVSFTEQGIEKVEMLLKEKNLIRDNLFSGNSELIHCLNQALKANVVMHKNIDYISHKGKIMIIDASTGRIMSGRRYSDGLHQAIEAKENVKIEAENKTIASITYQNFFRLYKKLSGMTGTAETEVEEFIEIYNLEVYSIPTNLPIQRIDDIDRIYPSIEEKALALVEIVKERHSKGQPILIGTSSVEKSEYFSSILTEVGIKHSILNARNHENEAEIIAQAGRSYSVTIATNMAGRGTDIKLGGSDEHDKKKVMEVGGLCVIGTERHENRRIDNQLQGRAGRQGDPGYSIFLISIDDPLFRIFGNPNISLGSGKIVSSRIISKLIESAQQKVERMHFESRKNVLKYDDILNVQRKIIYSDRINIIRSKFDLNKIKHISHDLLDQLLDSYMGYYIHEWNLDKLSEMLNDIYQIKFEYDDNKRFIQVKDELYSESDQILDRYHEIILHDDEFDDIFRTNILSYTDKLWTDHINMLDKLRNSIYLQSYGQKDPFHEYQDISYNMFIQLRENIHIYLIKEYIKHAIEYKINRNLINEFVQNNIISGIIYFIQEFAHNNNVEQYIKYKVNQLSGENFIENCINKFICSIKEDNAIITEYIKIIAQNEPSQFMNNLSQFRLNKNILHDISNYIQSAMISDFNKNKYQIMNTVIILDKLRKITIRKKLSNIFIYSINNVYIPTINSRNSLCHCNSGLKYKLCHGKIKSDCLFSITI